MLLENIFHPILIGSKSTIVAKNNLSETKISVKNAFDALHYMVGKTFFPCQKFCNDGDGPIHKLLWAKKGIGRHFLKYTVGNIFTIDPNLAQRIQNLALTIHLY